MIEIDAYTFSKRNNSTARPSESSEIQLNGVLKEPCSILNPTLIVTGWNFDYNYIFISPFRRFYFVTDCVVLDNNRCEIRCRVDALATYRSEILSTKCYVSRSATQHNARIADTFYPTLTGSNQLISSQEFIKQNTPTFIIGVIGAVGVGSITGAVSYYYVSETDLGTLMRNIFDATHYEGTELTDDVVKTFFNPSQYIITCMYMPFLSASGGSDSIQLGWWDSGVKGTKASVRTTLDDITITIPRVNDNSEHYINYEPWSTYRLYVPYIGYTDISSAMLHACESITISSQIDTATGQLMCKVTGSNGKKICTLEGKCCADIPLAQTVATTGSLTDTLGAGIGFLAKGLGSQMISEGINFGGAVQDFGDALLANNSQVSVKGNMGAISERFFETNCFLVCDTVPQADKDTVIFGDPLCKTVTLSDLGNGYVKTINAKFAIDRITDTEKTTLETLFNEGGVYIE